MPEQDWFAGFEPERPEVPIERKPTTPSTGKPSQTWKPGDRRVLVMALCCEKCGALNITRQNAYGQTMYWLCKTCGNRQKESASIRPSRANTVPV